MRCSIRQRKGGRGPFLLTRAPDVATDSSMVPMMPAVPAAVSPSAAIAVDAADRVLFGVRQRPVSRGTNASPVLIPIDSAGAITEVKGPYESFDIPRAHCAATRRRPRWTRCAVGSGAKHRRGSRTRLDRGRGRRHPAQPARAMPASAMKSASEAQALIAATHWLDNLIHHRRMTLALKTRDPVFR
jgi:hypothetical protein